MPQPSHNQQQGIFVAIEGTDGSGKGTQCKLLAEHLAADGHDVAVFDFPQYDQPSSYFVGKYLNGAYGTVDQVGPYTASIFYALDRYDAANAIRQALSQGKIVLANRFTGSNMAHQGTKFSNAEERRGYFIWLDNLEFEMLKIPRPDINLVLRVPAEIAQQHVDQKGQRSYTTSQRDIHEADLSHLQRSVEVYDDLCQLFPKDFSRLDCVRSEQLLSIEAVAKLVYEKLQPLLPHVRHGQGKTGSIQSGTNANGQPADKPPKTVASRTNPAASQSIPADQPPVQAAKKTNDGKNPYVAKQNDTYHITTNGKTYLQQAVTDPDGDVYAFTDTLSPATIAAAMARLSRRGDDMRVTLLDEFAYALDQDNDRKDEQLLHRVITAYGDDSVQQLVGVHLAVENASNILTKKLEWGRLASYLEQSTRYIYYDQKDAQGNYRYHTPEHFDTATRLAYRQALDGIFDTYSHVVRQLTDYIREHSTTPETERDGAWKSATRAQACDAARPLLPVATTSTVGIFASGQALESLIMHLMADELPEAQATGKQLLREARKVMPAFLERADKPERGGAMVAYRANTRAAMAQLAAEILPSQHTTDNQAVTLTDIWPRNELDLVADMLYEHSDQPLQTIRDLVATWPYEQKQRVLQTYMGERLNRRMRPGRALEKAHYSWDLLCDYGIFRDLQRHRMVDDLEWQALTPRFGYDIPKLVEDAGLSDAFESCFDASLQLYSLLQRNDYAIEAQYAVLLGHKMRWKVTYNAREAFHLHELRTSPQGHPGYRKLVGQMHQTLAEAHPLLTEAMRFVNRDEDPELTRLAAERYTQFKLEQLGPSDHDA